MIRTLFHGKADCERAVRKGALPAVVAEAIVDLLAHVEIAKTQAPLALTGAGFGKTGFTADHVQTEISDGYWLDRDDTDPRRTQTRTALQPFVAAARQLTGDLSETERGMVDFAVVSRGGFSAYLGGPIVFARTRQALS